MTSVYTLIKGKSNHFVFSPAMNPKIFQEILAIPQNTPKTFTRRTQL